MPGRSQKVGGGGWGLSRGVEAVKEGGKSAQSKETCP